MKFMPIWGSEEWQRLPVSGADVRRAELGSCSVSPCSPRVEGLTDWLFLFYSLFFSGDNNNSVKDTIQLDAWRAIQYRPIYGHYKMPVDSSTTDFQESFSTF